MEVMYMLVAISITVALGFLGAFLWAVRNGQFADKYTPAVRILFNDDEEKTKDKNK